MMEETLILITPPSTEPVSLPEAQRQCSATDPADDTFLNGLISTARDNAERFLRRAILSQTYKLFLHEFPCADASNRHGSIYLPAPPLQSVTHVKYYNTAGTLTTLVVDTDYVVDYGGELGGRIHLPYNVSWPTVQDRANAVEIQFVAGWKNTVPESTTTIFADTGVPRGIINGILLDVQLLYQRDQLAPEEARKLEDSRLALLCPWRVLSMP